MRVNQSAEFAMSTIWDHDPETGELIEGGKSNAGEYSVSEIANALKRTLEDTFGHVRVRGEISGYVGAVQDVTEERALRPPRCCWLRAVRRRSASSMRPMRLPRGRCASWRVCRRIRIRRSSIRWQRLSAANTRVHRPS